MKKYSVTSPSGSFCLKSNYWKHAIKEADDYYKNKEPLTLLLHNKPRWLRIDGKWFRLEEVK